MQTQIKTLRRQAGLTQVKLAELLGYGSSSVITMWENGERKPPSDKLPQLATILNCTIDDLFKDDLVGRTCCKEEGRAKQKETTSGN